MTTIFHECKKQILMNIILLAAFIWFHVLAARYYNNFISNSDMVTGFNYLSALLGLSFYLFIVLMIVSYMYFRYINKSGIRDILTHLEYTEYLLKRYIFLFVAAMIFFLSALSWNIVAIRDYLPDTALLNQVVKAVVLYFGLNLIMAVIVGSVLAGWKQKWKFVVTGILAIFMTSPFFEILGQGLAGETKYLYFILRWFQAGPRSTHTAIDPICGISTDYTRYAVSLMWICIFNLCAMYIYGCKKKTVFAIVGCAVLVAAGIYVKAPWFGDDIGNSTTWAELHSFYYYKHPVKEEVADYKVVEYKMNMTIDDQLHNKVQIIVDKPGLPQYKFTLHHQYIIDNIKNAKGEQLEYERDGDSVIINGERVEDTIIFNYHGNAAGGYANREWITLRSEFCFYPQAGIHPLYNLEDYIHQVNNNRLETAYNIKIHTKQQVFCNLSSVGNNQFEGRAAAITLRGGFLKEYHYRDVTVIYAYLDRPMLVGEEVMQETIDKMYELEEETGSDYSISGKTIYIGSEITYPEVLFYEDHIEMTYISLVRLIEDYYRNYLRTSKNAERYIRTQ